MNFKYISRITERGVESFNEQYRMITGKEMYFSEADILFMITDDFDGVEVDHEIKWMHTISGHTQHIRLTDDEIVIISQEIIE